jgi:hypothetical protein
LLEDVRGLVISRAFAARPRRVEIAAVEVAEAAEAAPQAAEQGAGKKRKRRRH